MTGERVMGMIEESAPVVDAIPLSTFAHELDLICLKLKRADISDEHRKELEAEKKYMVGWINNWLYNKGIGFNGWMFHGVTAEEIIKRWANETR